MSPKTKFVISVPYEIAEEFEEEIKDFIKDFFEEEAITFEREPPIDLIS